MSNTTPTIAEANFRKAAHAYYRQLAKPGRNNKRDERRMRTLSMLITLMDPEQMESIENHHMFSELRMIIASYASDHTLPVADQKKFGVLGNEAEKLLH